MGGFEVFGELGEEFGAVFGSGLSVLFKFDDVATDLPVGFEEGGVDLLGGLESALGEAVGNERDEVLVVWGLGVRLLMLVLLDAELAAH